MVKLLEEDEMILGLYAFVQGIEFEQSGRDAINQDLESMLERGVHTQEQHDEMMKQLDEIDGEIKGRNN